MYGFFYVSKSKNSQVMHFSESMIIESIPDGNKMNGVGLFLIEKAYSTLLRGNQSLHL